MRGDLQSLPTACSLRCWTPPAAFCTNCVQTFVCDACYYHHHPHPSLPSQNNCHLPGAWGMPQVCPASSRYTCGAEVGPLVPHTPGSAAGARHHHWDVYPAGRRPPAQRGSPHGPWPIGEVPMTLQAVDTSCTPCEHWLHFP